MIQHHTLGSAGRAAGINDGRQIVGSNGLAPFLERTLSMLIQQFFTDREYIEEEVQFYLSEFILEIIELFVLRGLDNRDHMFDVRKLADERHQVAQHLLVLDHDNAALRMV